MLPLSVSRKGRLSVGSEKTGCCYRPTAKDIGVKLMGP